MTQLTVSKLAATADVTTDSVRFYEREGLLKPADRGANGYRVFDEQAVERLGFIKGAQTMGLRLREIRELLEVRDRGLCPCRHAEAITRRRIEEVDAAIKGLQAIRRQLLTLANQLPPSDPTDLWPCEVAFAGASRGGDSRDKG